MVLPSYVSFYHVLIRKYFTLFLNQKLLFTNVLVHSAGCYHLTGLVHVSEVSWDLVQDVRDVLHEGDEVRVKIIKIDR